MAQELCHLRNVVFERKISIIFRVIDTSIIIFYTWLVIIINASECYTAMGDHPWLRGTKYDDAKRNLYSCKREIKSDAYQIYVRPILEYAVCSWAPHTKCNIYKLELVQRRAARFAMNDYHPTSSVTDMINKLKWNSLNHRRDTIRLQMMYKIIHRIVDLNLPDYITFNCKITRGHDYKLTMPFTRIDSYKFY